VTRAYKNSNSCVEDGKVDGLPILHHAEFNIAITDCGGIVRPFFWVSSSSNRGHISPKNSLGGVGCLGRGGWRLGEGLEQSGKRVKHIAGRRRSSDWQEQKNAEGTTSVNDRD
jgi:hypothetical protein